MKSREVWIPAVDRASPIASFMDFLTRVVPIASPAPPLNKGELGTEAPPGGFRHTIAKDEALRMVIKASYLKTRVLSHDRVIPQYTQMMSHSGAGESLQIYLPLPRILVDHVSLQSTYPYAVVPGSWYSEGYLGPRFALKPLNTWNSSSAGGDSCLLSLGFTKFKDQPLLLEGVHLLRRDEGGALPGLSSREVYVFVQPAECPTFQISPNCSLWPGPCTGKSTLNHTVLWWSESVIWWLTHGPHRAANRDLQQYAQHLC
ncbi:hypothetical protein HAX54_023892, partial [Datura stramonium]|nr:hypothetical protein [Datura stramonium]